MKTLLVLWGLLLAAGCAEKADMTPAVLPAQSPGVECPNSVVGPITLCQAKGNAP